MEAGPLWDLTAPAISLPNMETSELNKSPTHSILYKVLAPMNFCFFIYFFKPALWAYPWMGQGMGVPFRFENLGFFGAW